MRVLCQTDAETWACATGLDSRSHSLVMECVPKDPEWCTYPVSDSERGTEALGCEQRSVRSKLHKLTVTLIQRPLPPQPLPLFITFLGENDEFGGLECFSIQCPGDGGRGIRGHLALE